MTSRLTRAGQTITYAYDTLNRLVTKTPPSPEPVATYTYDLAGRMTSANDNSAPIAAIATGGTTISYTATTAYDARNQPTAVTWSPAPAATSPPSGTLVTFGYTYNAVNQRTGETVSDPTWIGYPAGAGTTGYTANSLNQYTAVGGTTPAYDGNGNLTFDGTATLAYDSENRLVAATGGGNTAAYAFDARGRRKLRTVNGVTTITVTGAEDRALLDYDGSTGQILRWYAQGPGPNAVLGQMNVAAGTRDTLLPDTLGSVIASVDAGGTVTKSGYQPFGLAPAPPAPFGFTGQRLDAETGLYHYRARHYSPDWGRFTQPDPIGYQGGANLYAYVYNDPLNLLDPEGLAALNAIQAGLTVASFCPSVCGSVFSAGDSLVSALRGNYGDAAISAVAAGIGIFSDAGVAKLGLSATKSAIGVASGVGEVLPMTVVKTLPPGTAGGIVNEAKALTYATGNEHAIVRLTTGERALVSGGPGGISFAEGQVKRIIGHTHPYTPFPPTGPSALDISAIRTLGQTRSYLLERGQITRFGP